MKTAYLITVLCAYCKKFMSMKEGEGVSGTSHSICDTCLTAIEERGWEFVDETCSSDKEENKLKIIHGK